MASITVFAGACSQDAEKTTGTNGTPAEIGDGIVGRGIQEMRAAISGGDLQAVPVAFTDRNIEWFNTATREIRFRDIEPAENLQPYRQIDFELDGEALFSAATAVTPIDSRILYDLVLYAEQGNGCRYYLYDGYPHWAVATEQAKANAAVRSDGWNKFLAHLQSDGKLRHETDAGPTIPGDDTPNTNMGDIGLIELPHLYSEDVSALDRLYVLRSEEEMERILADKSYKGIDFTENTVR